MSLTRTHALYVRELRGWRRRFWWMPVVAALAVTLPLSLPQSVTNQSRQQRWEYRYLPINPGAGQLSDDDDDFLNLPLRTDLLRWSVLATIATTFLLAGWLARELRSAEVRDDTLGDLVITTIQPGELFTAQLAAAWTIASVPLAGALPVFFAFGVRTGRSPAELLLGLSLLLAAPLLGACLGGATLWWKRLVLVSARDRAFRFWLLGFVLYALALSWGLAALVTYPNRRWVEAALPKRLRSEQSYFDELLIGNFVLGAGLLAMTWILVCVARALWRRGRLARCLLLVAILWIGWRVAQLHPQATIQQTIASTSGVDADWMVLGRLRWYEQLIGAPFILPWLVPQVFGSDQYYQSRGEWSLEFDPFLQPTLLGGVFWCVLALAAALLTWFDLHWVMLRPWTIAAIQRPEIAPLMLELGGQGHRPRPRRYGFESRNPVWDLMLVRSSGSQVVVMVWFAILLAGTTASLFLNWPRLRNEEPMFHSLSDPLQTALVLTIALCCLHAVNCGMTIAHLRMTQQWWAFLSTPLRLRTVLAGVCLPRLIEVGIMLLCVGPVLAVAYAVRVEFWDSQLSFLFLYLAGFAAGFIYIIWAVSLWSASRAKNPTRTTLMTLIVAPIVASAFPGLWAWGLDRQDTAYRRFQPWGVELPLPAWESPPWQYLAAAVPIVVPLLLATFLLWRGVRRLRWETR